MNIRIYDSNFVGDAGCSKAYPPKRFYWIRSGVDTRVTFFTDYHLHRVKDPSKSDVKIAWLIEPRELVPHIYKLAESSWNKFSIVLTHDSHLLSIANNGVFCPVSMSWIQEQDWVLRQKTNKLSIIASEKKLLGGHQLRHRIIQRCSRKMDVFGRGYRPVANKAEALSSYCFSVVIENSRVDRLFTEKIIDAMATFTVPIYWGATRIGEFFDSSGIIVAGSESEIVSAVESVSIHGKKMYDSMFGSVKKNHETAKSFRCAEDWIYDNILLPRKLV